MAQIGQNSRIFVAGHRGLVGSAITRALRQAGFENLLVRDRSELDLSDRNAVRAYFAEQKPDYVFLAAAKVGGIAANQAYPADFIAQNLAIEMNLIEAAHATGVERMLFLGSSCIYPKFAPQPIPESSLLTGPLEPTNRPYAIAKIAGIEMCWALNRQFGTRYLAAMPTNLYGPNDNYDPNTSHVIPALVRKFVEAVEAKSAEVVVWGTGRPRREFLHADDLGRACLLLMALADDELDRITGSEERPPLVNVGSGSDVTISELATLIAERAGFSGRIVFDPSKPDGTPQKLMDSSRMRALGWVPTIGLREGICEVVTAFAGRSATSSAVGRR